MIEFKKDINTSIRYQKSWTLINNKNGKGLPSDLAHIARIDKVSDHSNLKILTLKQMLQRLPIALAQVTAGYTSENLLNGIRQIIYFPYWVKEITKISIW